MVGFGYGGYVPSPFALRIRQSLESAGDADCASRKVTSSSTGQTSSALTEVPNQFEPASIVDKLATSNSAMRTTSTPPPRMFSCATATRTQSTAPCPKSLPLRVLSRCRPSHKKDREPNRDSDSISENQIVLRRPHQQIQRRMCLR